MASKKTFNFKLGDNVSMKLSNEAGTVISRMNSLEGDPQYYVRYLGADGRQVEGWVSEAALAV